MPLKVERTRCNLCGRCLEVCPFDAVIREDDEISFGPACRLCQICIKQCPKQAIQLVRRESGPVLSDYRDVLVVGEVLDGAVHPITYELMGKGRELAESTSADLHCLLIGSNLADLARDVLEYDVDYVHIYDHPELANFRIEPFAATIADLADQIKPNIVLMGATPIGRSLAPRVAVRFRTGLTADCTCLEARASGELIQIRPAFGGNVMAQIITPHHRPQMATVRYKVMNSAKRSRRPHSRVVPHRLPATSLRSAIRVIENTPAVRSESISDAEVIVVAGRGFRNKKDLGMAEELAQALGGKLGVTRPLVEAGWADHERQIGLSGRTVRPRLLITLGVSGAIQFSASIAGSECIVAVNQDRQAPILARAHFGLVGDLYEVVPELLKRLKEGDGDVLPAAQ